MPNLSSEARPESRTWLVWSGAIVAILALYWLCLRFLFPGYFEPLSAFHVDFFEYASHRDRSLANILGYPRPAAYFAMKVLGFAGLYSVLVGGIALALTNVVLTVVLARSFLAKPIAALPFMAALFSLLLFAHPDFYFEHRHDLPAEASYFFAISSLLCWNVLFRTRNWLPRILLLGATFCLAILFVFAKETYFGSMLCLVLGLALLDHANRKWHAGFLFVLIALEAASVLWNAHLNGPFVNTHADAANTYRMVLTPGSLLATYWYYLSHLLNPYLVVVIAFALYRLKDRRRELIVATIFFLAGLAAFGPHAVLPNHVFEEYSWAAAPLAFVPILLLGERILSSRATAALIAALMALAIFAPFGYSTSYRELEQTYGVTQDRIGRHMGRSIAKLHAVPSGSRVLVAGLDAVYIPFQSESFTDAEFGGRTSWTVLIGPATPGRRPNKNMDAARISEVNLDSYDQLVTYDSEGSLRGIRAIKSITAAERNRPELLVPQLEPLARLVKENPAEGYRKFLAAAVCLDWGLWKEAQAYLEGSVQNGSATDPTYGQLMARLRQGLAEKQLPPILIRETTLSVNPSRIVDTEGGGIVVADLQWTISPPRACEIRLGAPDGKLFATASTSGKSKTEKWVTNGMKFYLQDVSGNRPLTPENTLAIATAEVIPK